MQAEPEQPWWQHCVFYQIYPTAFADGNDDGVGDLAGIIGKLDYLAWLGVEAIWLSPIYPSPMKDGGYDVQDYCTVSPLFGSLKVFDHLIVEAHRRSIKIILDWVPNHTSDRHPWFIESRSSRTNPKRNWYVWRDEPNNWQADIRRGSAWTLDPITNQYYLHSYLAEEPDLNWDNLEVRQAMHDVLRFWLDHGIDGFRADVINMIAKDETFADWPSEEARLAHRATRHNTPKIHTILRELRAVLDSYPQKPVFVGELWLTDPSVAATYFGANDELGLFFNAGLMNAGWDIGAWKAAIQTTAGVANGSLRWPSTVLASHDEPRISSRMGSMARARATAVLMMTLPGSPFIYAGDEFGLADGPAKNMVDPGGRDGSRSPIPWNASAEHGWSHTPRLPFPTNASQANYQTELVDKSSILWLYRQLIEEFKSNAELASNDLELLDTPTEILAFRRGELRIVANFSDQPVAYRPDAAPKLRLSSAGNRAYLGTLQPYEAVILQPVRRSLARQSSGGTSSKLASVL